MEDKHLKGTANEFIVTSGNAVTFKQCKDIINFVMAGRVLERVFGPEGQETAGRGALGAGRGWRGCGVPTVGGPRPTLRRPLAGGQDNRVSWMDEGEDEEHVE